MSAIIVLLKKYVNMKTVIYYALILLSVILLLMGIGILPNDPIRI